MIDLRKQAITKSEYDGLDMLYKMLVTLKWHIQLANKRSET